MKRAFNTRAFTALLMTFSGLGLPITGYMNHFLGFDPMGVERHAWMTAHNVLAIIFSVSAVWHVALNRQAWMRHVKGLAGRMPSISREALYAACTVLIIAGFLVGHAFHVEDGHSRGKGHSQSQSRQE